MSENQLKCPSARQIRYPILSMLKEESLSKNELSNKLFEHENVSSFSSDVLSNNLSKAIQWLTDHKYLFKIKYQESIDFALTEKGLKTLTFLEKIDHYEVSNNKEKSMFKVLNDYHAIKQSNESMFFNQAMTLGTNRINTTVKHDKKQLNFFHTNDFSPGSKRNVIIWFNGKQYDAKLEEVRNYEHHHRLTWGYDLCEAMQRMFPSSGFIDDYPIAHFLKVGDDEYYLFFKGKHAVDYSSTLNTEIDDSLTSKVTVEGGKIQYYGTRYERKKSIRDKALIGRQLVCEACGFDFEKVYGERGKGFIEVHHVKPLSEVKSEHEIDVEKDLALLCSNCHRMIHRESNGILTIEQLKTLIRNQLQNQRRKTDEMPSSCGDIIVPEKPTCSSRCSGLPIRTSTWIRHIFLNISNISIAETVHCAEIALIRRRSMKQTVRRSRAWQHILRQILYKMTKNGLKNN